MGRDAGRWVEAKAGADAVRAAARAEARWQARVGALQVAVAGVVVVAGVAWFVVLWALFG